MEWIVAVGGARTCCISNKVQPASSLALGLRRSVRMREIGPARGGCVARRRAGHGGAPRGKAKHLPNWNWPRACAADTARDRTGGHTTQRDATPHHTTPHQRRPSPSPSPSPSSPPPDLRIRRQMPRTAMRRGWWTRRGRPTRGWKRRCASLPQLKPAVCAVSAVPRQTAAQSVTGSKGAATATDAGPAILTLSLSSPNAARGVFQAGSEEKMGRPYGPRPRAHDMIVLDERLGVGPQGLS